MSVWRTLDGKPPRIIAHRGASGLRPEHTLPGYELAIAQGADLIEPDLVATRDGVLIARHERELSRSTDVAKRLQWRDGTRRFVRETAQWFADDFDAARLSELRAVQPFPARSRAFDGQFAIPLFSEILDLAASTWRAGKTLGVYPEIKHSTELLAKGIDSTALLIAELGKRSLAAPTSPVWVQCFEIAPLIRVHETCGNATFALFEWLNVNQLLALHRDAPWLSGVALSKANLIGAVAERDLIAKAHDLGWQVHAWTLRDDAVSREFDNVQAEYRALFAVGADALFCDFPEGAVNARQRGP
jgi:glycerophosphoryl diester phosphodiesterase